jgi:hypothetical protein
MAILTPPPEKCSNLEPNAQVLVNACFESSSITILNDSSLESYLLALEIMPLCSRTIVVNRKLPVIPFLNSNEKGLPHGLPQLNLVDRGGDTVCSFPLDMVFVEDFNTRVAEMSETNAPDFQILLPNQWTRFYYDVSSNQVCVVDR